MKREMNNRVLLIGNYGSKNIGDETILKGVAKDILDSAGAGGAVIYVPTRNSGFVETYHKELEGVVVPFRVYDFSSFLSAAKKCGTVVIGGGGIWSGYTGPLAKLIPVFALFAKAAGKKVIFKSFGLYDTAAAAEKFLVNAGAYFADACSVRDDESYMNLWAGLRKRSLIVDDCAIDFLKKLEASPAMKERYLAMSRKSSQYKKLGECSREGKLIIGFSVKPLKDSRETKNVISAVSKCIGTLQSEYKENVCFAFFPFAKTGSAIEDDTKMIGEIEKNVSCKKSIIVLEHDNPLVYYFMIKHHVKKFIGMRYHSVIFSSIAGTPFLAIPYENKVAGFLKTNAHKHEYGQIAPGKVTAEELVNFVEEERC